MRILWASNYTSQSGYSNQARLFVPAAQRLGHEITVFALSNGSGMPVQVGGFQLLPTYHDPLGNDMLVDHARRVGAHAVISLIDVWGLRPDVMEQVNWYPITPIDHTPVPPHVAEHLKAAQRPIAMSRFGLEQMRDAGFDPYYVPHAVDPNIWRPGDKATARQSLNVPQDVFWVAFVGVNDSVPSRKGLPELLAAWAVFSQRHTDARLYLHTAANGNLPTGAVNGVSTPQIMRTFGIDPRTVVMVDQYRYKTGIPTAELAAMAQASDVLVLPTRGEGFGLPLLEFQRVGCPVITTDFATGPELCFGGWLVEHEPAWSWQSAIHAKPGIASIVEALEAAYADRDNPARKARAIEGAREYDVDVVMSRYFAPALRDIAERILDEVQVTV